MSNHDSGLQGMEYFRISRWAAGLLLTVLLTAGAQVALQVTINARLDERVSHLQALVEKLETQMVSGTQFRYTSMDAANDKQMMQRLFDLFERRLTASESRLLEMEKMHTPPSTHILK